MKKQIIIFIATCAALLVTFQNCTQTSYGGKDNGVQRSGGTGTGNGYDGKVYAILSDVLCPDKSNIEAAILVTGSETEAYLIRESCATVQAQLLQPQSYAIRADGTLQYGGETYSAVQDDDVAPRDPAGPPGQYLPDGTVPQIPPTPTLAPYYFLNCNRTAYRNTDGYDGKVVVRLSNINGQAFQGQIFAEDNAGTFSRVSMSFGVNAVSDNNGGVNYSMSDRKNGEYFQMNHNGLFSYGAYQVSVVETIPASNTRAETTEYWNGMQPFTCTRSAQ